MLGMLMVGAVLGLGQTAESVFVPIGGVGELKPGMTCTINRMVFVAVDFMASTDLWLYVRATDKEGMSSLLKRRRIVVIRTYTPARVLEVRDWSHLDRGIHIRLRIQEGPLEGKEVYALIRVIGTMQPKAAHP